MWKAAGIAALLATLGAGAQAQDVGAIEAVIAGQLQDFNARDVTGAFDDASPMIRGLFGSAANFGLMVENGYPMVWTNQGATFLELRDVEGQLWQKVLLTDAAGATHVLDYAVIETPQGWKIDGVVIVPAPDVGV